jgi:SAM-dependent methyltransferase
MDDREVGRYWEGNAAAWTALSRAGYDVCRDLFNTPSFLALLPDVTGLRGLDVGCGEGHNTRLVARRGARITAVDIAPTFIRYAREAEAAEPLGITYQVASGLALPFGPHVFDFATAFMSVMDMAEPERALAEVFRVLKPGGFFQFSVIHPVFSTPYREWVRDEAGRKVALAVADYFRGVRGDVEEWTFYAAPEELKARYPRFKVPRFDLTVSQWLNAIAQAGFRLKAAQEPFPDDAALAVRPELYDCRIAPLYIHFLCRKDAAR